MSYSPWSMLSPVQWVKWTWSAVHGTGGEGEREENLEKEGEIEEDDEDISQEDKSAGCRRGNFETPEAETPVHGPLGGVGEQDGPTACTLEGDEQRVPSCSSLDNSYLENNFNHNEHSETRHKGLLDQMVGLDAMNNVKDQKGSVHLDADLNQNLNVKSTTTRPPSLDVKVSLDGADPNEVDDEVPPLNTKYQSEPHQGNGDASSRWELVTEDDSENSASHLRMEFSLGNDASSMEVIKHPARKLGKKPSSKSSHGKQKAKPLEQDLEKTGGDSLEGMPAPKSCYSFDASLLDDPNFNPFGSSSKMSGSPILPKGSYSFDPDVFDDTMDPFKPSKILPTDSNVSLASETMASDLVCQKLDFTLEVEVKGRQSLKSNAVMTAAKGMTHGPQPLVLDVGSQEDLPTESMAHCKGHATDEEKLASSGSGQNPCRAENGLEEDDELGKKQSVSKGTEVMTDGRAEKEAYVWHEDLGSRKSTKLAGDGGNPVLDMICISEVDKAAVLTLIREEIIAKEIEANEWKRKYEDSRQEVMEMRSLRPVCPSITEHTTLYPLPEDEQRTAISSQKSIQQLTLEKEQALADLNSVERSLSDLFRRYENMKGVLEGFKKNEEVLKRCAQEYLARVRQEEQRYQTLKIHAEEKLDKANEEIAQVRSKANAESVALHASLRKEQMKVESLERALHQKNQEIEELTKICDELIAKMGKTE
ncbi:transforming acidic coiled-coil-containing protein 1-like [Arapaima gigas]